MGPAPTTKSNKRPVGAGLSLDKFASLGVSKFDKRQKLERIQKQKLIKYSKYKKLKHKLEAQGILASVPVKDSIAELEALDADGSGDGRDDSEHDVGENAERIATHAQAGPGRMMPHGNAPRDAQPGSGGVSRQKGAQSGAAATPDTRRQQLRQGEQQDTGPRKRPRDAEGEPGLKGDQRNLHGRAEQHAASGEAGAAEGAQRANAAGRRAADTGAQEGAPSAGIGRDRHDRKDGHGGMKLSRLQRLAQKVAEEKAEKQRAKEAALKEREARMKKVAAAEKGRKEQKHLHFKRNAKGQPLMRYRMEKLLSQLQQPGQ